MNDKIYNINILHLSFNWLPTILAMLRYSRRNISSRISESSEHIILTIYFFVFY